MNTKACYQLGLNRKKLEKDIIDINREIERVELDLKKLKRKKSSLNMKIYKINGEQYKIINNGKTHEVFIDKLKGK